MDLTERGVAVFYILNINCESTVVVGVDVVKNVYKVKDVFEVNSGYMNFLEGKVSDRLFNEIVDFQSHKYYVVLSDAVYSCGSVSMDTFTYAENFNDIQQHSVYKKLIPKGLELQEFVGTMLIDLVPKTERQYFASAAFVKKELLNIIKSYFESKEAKLLRITTDVFALVHPLKESYSTFFLEIETGKYVIRYPEGIIVFDNIAFSKEAAMLLMMEHAQRLFSYEKEEGLPPILDLSAEKRQFDSKLSMSISTNRMKEVYASVGVCAAWSGKPRERKPAPPSEANSYISSKEEGDANGFSISKLREFFNSRRNKQS